ncbi:MAG: HyaD/HybD family hydrogenase maturation endopeptidase [Phycisphaerae bacterium]|nr:HyaD/HybD family hydrogenase maturation endopeptidase [Phycisphaerae bacterium]
MTTNDRILVLGLGNPLMSDEGIGGFLIEEFIRQKDKSPNVDFLDAGTGGMTLLTLIENRKKVIIIDCAYMGTEPGTIKRFTPQEVNSMKKLMHYSLHEIDILKVLVIAKKLDTCPPNVVIFGIEPFAVELRPQISNTLRKKIDIYIDEISLDFNHYIKVPPKNQP